MGYYYLDASALVKYYVLEPGSTWIRDLANALNPDSSMRVHTIVIAEATIAEGAAALAVLQRMQKITRRERSNAFRAFRKDIADGLWGTIPIITDDFDNAASLTQLHPLKAYDAVQLAVAMRHSQALAEHNLSVTFVSGDRTLLAAAQAEGLVTDNPFDHISPQDTPSN